MLRRLLSNKLACVATQLKIFAPPFSQVLPIEAGRFLIDTTSAPTDLYLPFMPPPGVNFRIYDATRNAANFNITIHTLYGELINGAPTLVLNNNGDMADIFREDDSENFIATISGITSGGGGGGGGAAQSLKVYANNAQMAAEPLYNVIQMFYTRGRLAAGDNLGGGFYIWDQNETAVADGNQYVASIFTGVGRFVQIMS